MNARALVGVMTTAVLLAVAPAAVADPARITQLRQLSTASPYPGGCGVKGNLIPDSEVEPHLVVSPRDERNMVAYWQQDRFSDAGGASLNLGATTFDGGATWQRTLPPRTSRCTGGLVDKNSDPWLAYAPDGRVYAIQLGINRREPEGPQTLPGRNSIIAYRSDDGGASWEGPFVVAAETDQFDFVDKPAISTDPNDSSHVYAMWNRQYGIFLDHGDVLFSESHDSGLTWSAPRTTYTDIDEHPAGSVALTLPDRSLLHVFASMTLHETVTPVQVTRWPILAQRSEDGGRTWSRAYEVADPSPTSPQDPERGTPIRTPYAAVPPVVMRDGTVFMAWYDRKSNTEAPLYLSRSTDGGVTWPRISTVVDRPGQRFGLALAGRPDGSLGLTYYDFRNDVPGDAPLTTDVWFADSRDGGLTWEETHLAGPFDMRAAPASFLGDYFGLVPTKRGFAAAFTMAPPKSYGPSDVFFARIELGKKTKIQAAVQTREAEARSAFRVVVRATYVRAGRRLPLGGAAVRFAGRSARTDSRGRAELVARVGRAGLYTLRVVRRGFRATSKVVRVASPGD